MNNEKGYTLIELQCALIFVFIFWVLSHWTQRNINFWFDVDYSIWLYVFLTILFNNIIIELNIISEIIRFIFF